MDPSTILIKVPGDRAERSEAGQKEERNKDSGVATVLKCDKYKENNT